jgi:hypothetical protein
MLLKLALSLQKNNCSALLHLNPNGNHSTGKTMIRSETGSEAKGEVHKETAAIIKNHSIDICRIHYFFLWNKAILGGIGSPVILENFGTMRN